MCHCDYYLGFPLCCEALRTTTRHNWVESVEKSDEVTMTTRGDTMRDKREVQIHMLHRRKKACVRFINTATWHSCRGTYVTRSNKHLSLVNLHEVDYPRPETAPRPCRVSSSLGTISRRDCSFLNHLNPVIIRDIYSGT